MADRTAAGIFSTLFGQLAEDLERADNDASNIRHRQYIQKLAREMWGQMWSYDFNECQMDCDDALVQLGLARIVDDEVQYMNQEMTKWQP
jgi:hypothetical protein